MPRTGGAIGFKYRVEINKSLYWGNQFISNDCFMFYRFDLTLADSEICVKTFLIIHEVNRKSQNAAVNPIYGCHSHFFAN